MLFSNSNIWKILDWMIPKVCFSSDSKMSIIVKSLFQTLLTLMMLKQPKLNKTDES